MKKDIYINRVILKNASPCNPYKMGFQIEREREREREIKKD
jgi:hypothetical protein